MKTLQNNFTTPEQSKRLLELGVPADSADCYWQKSASLSGEWEYKPYIGECVAIKENLFSYRNGYVLPCWSVGRLIELLVTCAIDKDYIGGIIADIAKYAAAVETYVNVITYLCKIKDLDFSKLEE